MSSWFLFALLSMVALAANELAQKISLTQKASISAITNNFVVWTLQGIFGLILVSTFQQADFNFSLQNLFKLLIVALVYFLGGTFYYTSFKTNSPSLSIILGSISVIISTILGAIFFQEQIGLQKIIGIFLILVAIIIVHFHLKDKLSRANLLALLGGTCYGIAFTIDKSFAINASPMLYVSLLSFSVAIVSLIIKSRHIGQEISRLKSFNYYPMVASATFGTIFNFLMFTSYSRGGHVGVVDAINNSAIFLVIVMEVILLNDRSDLIKKIAGATIAVIGVTLLASLS